jgi:membrane protease YdiL (CAAX protease family)
VTVTVERSSRYELPLFCLLAFAISWAMHVPLALATLRSGDPTASISSPLNLLAPWGPAVAAIVVTALVMGRRGPGTLFRQLKVWRVGVRWYLIGALIYTLGEELGWRAYALRRLQEHSTALVAGLTVGLLWGLWHVPTGRGGRGGRGRPGRRPASAGAARAWGLLTRAPT